MVKLEALQERAEKLGAKIDLFEDSSEGDSGPYCLRCATTGYHIWPTGLSLEDIVDALRCLELEQQGRKDAWADFGSQQSPSH